MGGGSDETERRSRSFLRPHPWGGVGAREARGSLREKRRRERARPRAGGESGVRGSAAAGRERREREIASEARCGRKPVKTYHGTQEYVGVYGVRQGVYRGYTRCVQAYGCNLGCLSMRVHLAI